MRNVDYLDVLNGALALTGMAPTQLLTVDFNKFREWANQRLQEAAEQYYWPDLMRGPEQRFFRADYAAGTAYANDGTISYFPQTQLYYQALKATTGNPPADSNGTLDTSRWAVAATSYTGDNFSATPTYVVGDIKFYPTTGRYYALHTAAVAGTLPTDTTKWGVLTVFDRYVAFAQTGKTVLGETLYAWDRNPRTDTEAVELEFEISENGVQITDDVPWVWLKYKVRLTLLTGSVWVATATYTGGTDQVYFDATGSRGNFWSCVTTTAAGESPLTTPAKWSKIEIPYIFKANLIAALYADWLLDAGQMEKYGLASGVANEKLDKQVMLLAGQEQQRRKTVVLTR